MSDSEREENTNIFTTLFNQTASNSIREGDVNNNNISQPSIRPPRRRISIPVEIISEDSSESSSSSNASTLSSVSPTTSTTSTGNSNKTPTNLAGLDGYDPDRPQKKNKKRSIVWDFFTKLSKNEVQCNLCDKRIEYISSTSKMLNHLVSKNGHFLSETALKKNGPNELKKRGFSIVPVNDLSDYESENDVVASDNDEEIEKLTKKYSKSKLNRLKRKLVKFIATTDQAISIVSHDGFISLMNECAPGWELPSRNYVSDKLIPETFQNCQDILKVQLRKPHSVSITTDIWKSNCGESYLGITSHYVDEHYEIQSNHLALKYIHFDHTASEIKEILDDVFDHFNINNKILAIATDNANTMLCVANQFENTISSPCVAHTMNLVLEDLFDPDKVIQKDKKNKEKGITDRSITELMTYVEYQKSVNELLSDCQKFVITVKNSEHLCKLMKECQQKYVTETQTKLVRDVPTRWNSTFLLLKSIDLNKVSLEIMEKEIRGKDLIRKNVAFEKFINYLPSIDRFQFIAELSDLLKPMYDFTVALSGTYYVTSSLVYPLVSEIVYNSLPQLKLSHHKVVMLQKLLIIILKRRFWSVLNDKIYKAATFLDVRYKTFFFVNDTQKEKCIKSSKEYIVEFWHNHKSLFETKNTSNSKKDQQDKQQKQASTQQQQQQQNLSQSKVKKAKQNSLLLSLNANNPSIVDHSQMTSSNVVDTQLELELSNYASKNVFIDKSFENPLEYFKNNLTSYPILSKIAIHLLSIPITTVPSESLFSQVGLTVTDVRNRLHNTTVEALTFLKRNFHLLN